VSEAQRLLILDYGSQYTQLIARRVREAHVYCEIHPPTRDLAWIRAFNPIGIVFSGGPNSVYDEGAPRADAALLESGIPILGVCYGMQLMAHLAGGNVQPAGEREFGPATIEILCADKLFAGFRDGESTTVWASHGDRIEGVPKGFVPLAKSPNAPVAAFAHESRPLYGLLFHPEVVHTPRGAEIIHNFLFRICGAKPSWTAGHFVEQAVRDIRARIGGRRAICGLSGGVDSAVAAALVNRAIGERLTCIFVDHGLLRANERQQVERTFGAELGVDLRVVDASATFLGKLADVADPEEKRRIIGHTFIDVFEDTARHVAGDVGFLVQGTLFARMGLDVVSPTMDVRMVWSYAAVPAGGLFMMLYSLERLLQVLQGREQA